MRNTHPHSTPATAANSRLLRQREGMFCERTVPLKGEVVLVIAQLQLREDGTQLLEPVARQVSRPQRPPSPSWPRRAFIPVLLSFPSFAAVFHSLDWLGRLD